MAMTKNPNYMGQDYPYDGVLIPPSLNEGIPIKRRQLAADAATSIAIGCLVYISGGTEANDATAAGAERGSDDRGDDLWVAVAPAGSTYLSFPYTTTATNTPWLVPNSSITLSNYQLAAEAEFTAVELRIGMKVWLLIGNDITADVVVGYDYYCGANGMPAAGGDPDGAAIDEVGHCFKAVASFTNMNWALFEYKGFKAYDDTA